MYLIVWKYEVLPDREKEFRAAYGPDGDWFRAFSDHEGYLGTELVGGDEPNVYVTIDRWESIEAFHAYMVSDRDRYELLDRRFEILTVTEDLVVRGSLHESESSG